MSEAGTKEGHYLLVFDYEGNIIDASASATDILGYSHDELLQMRRTDLRSDISQSDYDVLRTIIMSGIGSPAFDTVHRKKNGDFVPVKLRVKVLPWEESRFALVIGKVLTSDYELASDQKSKRYELSINTKGQILYMSNPLASLLGYHRIALIGTAMTKLFVTVPSDGFDALLAGERFFQIEHSGMQSQDGSIITCRLGFYPHQDDQDNFVGYDIVCSIE